MKGKKKILMGWKTYCKCHQFVDGDTLKFYFSDYVAKNVTVKTKMNAWTLACYSLCSYANVM